MTGKKNISLHPKTTTHIIRDRKKGTTIDLRHFNSVLNIDVKNKTAEVEGFLSFYNFVKETLKYKLVPKIVPEFRSITIGGAISGLGVESSSFKYGLVNDCVPEMSVITPEKGIVKCSENENSNLYRTLPNSFGSLGYVLKCKFELIDTKDYVEINTYRFSSSKKYFSELKNIKDSVDLDFIDGIIFSPKDFVIVTGKLVDQLENGFHTEDILSFPYYLYLKKRVTEYYR